MKTKKSEELKKALENAIAPSGEKISDKTLEAILRTLDEKKVLRYHKEHEISLLSTAGRVLVSIIEDPTMTIRAISVYLDLSETMIDKTVKQLISAGIITKTKVNRQNTYQINQKIIVEQPDIQHFYAAITKVFDLEKLADRVVEDEPF